MSEIRAVVVDPDAPNPLALADVEEAGAHEVVVDESGAAARDLGPYHLVLESVGGEVLGNALSMLTPGGTCVNFGASASAEVEFDARKFYLTGGARLYGFILFHEVLARPARLLQGLAGRGF